ncbi:MAG: BON domain-containing protein [Betaproteobacteria bacterium]
MRALLVTALMILSQPALAQGSGEPGGDPVRNEFNLLDRNRDGTISRVEALANQDVLKRFNAFDGDRDGRLSETEFAAVREDITRQAVLDAAITARVKAALLAERGIPSLSISVETYEGRVQLSGFVKSPDIVSRAGRVTAGVNGVRTVHNNIGVR